MTRAQAAELIRACLPRFRPFAEALAREIRAHGREPGFASEASYTCVCFARDLVTKGDERLEVALAMLGNHLWGRMGGAKGGKKRVAAFKKLKMVPYVGATKEQMRTVANNPGARAAVIEEQKKQHSDISTRAGASVFLFVCVRVWVCVLWLL
jgi:hypothetical protein